jgi:hypothetical protein
MQQSPSWEANRFSANREFPRILWNPKLHYRIYNRPLPVSTKSHINSVPVSPSHIFTVRFNIIFQSTLMSSKWPLSLRLPHQTPVWTYPVPSKSSLHLANSLATAVSDPGLYRLFISQVPNFMSPSLYLKRIRRSVRARDLVKCFATSLSLYDQ